MSTSDSSVSLSQPLYGASIGAAFRRFWAKYATFSGRASRSEFWWTYLVLVIINIVLAIIISAGGGGGAGMNASTSTGTMAKPSGLAVIGIIIFILWFLATIIPTLALIVRRLHDGNFSGGFIFLGLVPFVGGIILLVLYLLPSKPEGERFDK